MGSTQGLPSGELGTMGVKEWKMGHKVNKTGQATFRSLKYSSSHICTVDTWRIWSPNCTSARPCQVHCNRLCSPFSEIGWL